MASIESPRSVSIETRDLALKHEKSSASKKRCEMISALVTLVLLVVSMSLSIYFTDHPFGPTFPNTTLSIPLLVSLGGTLGFGVGFLVLFVRCVYAHQFLTNSSLDERISKIGRDVAILKQYQAANLHAN